MATDNGPSRNVTPGPIPSFKKPDPHLSDDPGPPPAYKPYRIDNEGDPATQYPTTRDNAVKGSSR